MSRKQLAPGLYLYDDLEEAKAEADERATREPIYVMRTGEGYIPVNAAQNRDYIKAGTYDIAYMAEPESEAKS